MNEARGLHISAGFRFLPGSMLVTTEIISIINNTPSLQERGFFSGYVGGSGRCKAPTIAVVVEPPVSGTEKNHLLITG